MKVGETLVKIGTKYVAKKVAVAMFWAPDPTCITTVAGAVLYGLTCLNSEEAAMSEAKSFIGSEMLKTLFSKD